MFAIGPDWVCSATLFWVEEVGKGSGLARTGSVQPMKQAKTAIHREIAVAITALNA